MVHVHPFSNQQTMFDDTGGSSHQSPETCSCATGCTQRAPTATAGAMAADGDVQILVMSNSYLRILKNDHSWWVLPPKYGDFPYTYVSLPEGMFKFLKSIPSPYQSLPLIECLKSQVATSLHRVVWSNRTFGTFSTDASWRRSRMRMKLSMSNASLEDGFRYATWCPLVIQHSYESHGHW